MKGFRRTVASVVIGVAVATIYSVGVTDPVAASQPCSGFASNYFAGAHSAAKASIFGSQAEIEYNNPDLCGSPGVSVVWSMVAADSRTRPGDIYATMWAQTGYGQFGTTSGFSSSGIHVFAQYTLACRSTASCGSGAQVKTIFAAAPSGTKLYTNALSSADHHIHMLASGVNLGETNYDPSTCWDPAWEGQFFGEKFYAGDDIVGTATDVTTLHTLQKMDSTGAFAFFSALTPIVTASRAHYQTYVPSSGGLGFNVWTDPS